LAAVLATIATQEKRIGTFFVSPQSNVDFHEIDDDSQESDDGSKHLRGSAPPREDVKKARWSENLGIRTVTPEEATGERPKR